MDYIDYVITQEGKQLSSEKIVINKFDNKVSRLVFELDGTIPGRLYFVMKNPKTGKYFPSLLTDNAIVIGNDVTNFVGRWDGILVGVSEDYDFDEYETLDIDKRTYISDTLKRIIVRDNFLSGDIERVNHPAIDEALDSFARNRDELADNLIQTGEDVSSCQTALSSCQEILDECTSILEEIRELKYNIESLGSALTLQYNNYHDSLQSIFTNYKAELDALVKEVI